jgi:hypothetical protein
MSFEDFEGTWEITEQLGDTGLNYSIESLSIVIVEEKSGLRHIVQTGTTDWTQTCNYDDDTQTLWGINCAGHWFIISRDTSSESVTLQCSIGGDSLSSYQSAGSSYSEDLLYGDWCIPDGGPDGGSWTALGGGSG